MLTIDSLSYKFSYALLFKDLSFIVKPGDLVFIAGENGSGKTTLLQIIAGLRSFNKGKIHFDSSFYQVDPKVKIYFEYLAADFNGLYKDLNAFENILFWTKIKGVFIDKQEILALLKNWGLCKPSVLNYLAVKHFSTGMKRKIALIKATLSPAPVLLLDEPNIGLDEKSCIILKEQLTNLKKEKRSIILTSHNQSIYDSIIDQVIELKKG